MVDIDMQHPICAWRAPSLVPREKASFPHRWPHLWHIGLRSVLLLVTLLCAGWGNRCSCGEPLPHTPTQSLSTSDCLFLKKHTHKQTSPRVSWDIYGFICRFREKQKWHEKATYGSLLMEHLSWVLTGTVTQGPLLCLTPLFEF